MNNLAELIKTKCPEGVHYKPLWSLTAWDKKFNAVDRSKQSKVIDYHYFLAGDLKPLIREDGTIKILTTNISNVYTYEELVEGFVSEGEIVCLPWGGNPVIQYYNGKFVTADNRIATSLNKNVLNNKFLYYYLNSKIDEISSFYRGSGIKHPDMSKVLDLMIPVPPIEVQNEIVETLDSFNGLIENLQYEFELRNTQYEHYRESLLDFKKDNAFVNQNNRSLIKYVEITEVAFTFIGLVTTMTKHYVDDGVLLLHNSDIKENKIVLKESIYLDRSFANSYTNRMHEKYDIVTVHTGDIGTSAVIDGPFVGSE